MKRAFAALAGTIAGLAALLGYKSGPPKKAQLATQAPTAPASPSATAPSATLPQGGGDDSGGEDGGGAPPPTAAPTTPPSTAAPSTAAPSTAAGTRTVTGPDVPNQFGDVQVQLVLQGTKIVDVKPLQMPFDRQRSYEISQAAAPILRQEVLQAQSANIDLLSGATYTSNSYAQSVQAALDQARA